MWYLHVQIENTIHIEKDISEYILYEYIKCTRYKNAYYDLGDRYKRSCII